LRNRPGVVLGVPFMEQFAITIDQKNGRVQLGRSSGAVAIIPPEVWERTGSIGGEIPAGDGPRRGAEGPPPTGRPMGFNLAGAPGELMVINVVAGSNAERAGIRNGDRLVEFDGTPVSQMSREVFQ